VKTEKAGLGGLWGKMGTAEREGKASLGGGSFFFKEGVQPVLKRIVLGFCGSPNFFCLKIALFFL